ncbi:arsenate reductase family protein [Sediminitomix flava]|uniref:Arsenate reductase n=1 Tax=Sediminitomix flava TaxID=379075 RepID=A0A315ZZ48_SEDFL|nr:glutaredoxin [Sediminitomix flava]PWJ42647.1 arsenate reductase [Sediminitomix flava]
MHKIGDPSTIELYVRKDEYKDKQTIALAKSLGRNVHVHDIGTDAFTKTIWKDILKKLNLTPKELMNKANPYYQKNIRGKDFDSEGWLDVLMHHPFLIKAPIAVWKNKVKLLNSPQDLLKI